MASCPGATPGGSNLVRGPRLLRFLMRGGGSAACFFAFDLLMLDGEDWRRRQLHERKTGLKRLLGRRNRVLRYVEHLEDGGAEMFEHACRLGLEGIVSKRRDGRCRSGPSSGWLKICQKSGQPCSQCAQASPSMMQSGRPLIRTWIAVHERFGSSFAEHSWVRGVLASTASRHLSPPKASCATALRLADRACASREGFLIVTEAWPSGQPVVAASEGRDHVVAAIPEQA
jgi:hypothetical protein